MCNDIYNTGFNIISATGEPPPAATGTVTPPFGDQINQKMNLFNKDVKDKKADECNKPDPNKGKYSFDNNNGEKDAHFNVPTVTGQIPVFTKGTGDYETTFKNSWDADALNCDVKEEVRIYAKESYYTFNYNESGEEGSKGRTLVMSDIIDNNGSPWVIKFKSPKKQKKQVVASNTETQVSNKSRNAKHLDVLDIEPPGIFDSSYASLVDMFGGFNNGMSKVGRGEQTFIPLNGVDTGNKMDGKNINSKLIVPDPKGEFTGSTDTQVANIKPVTDKGGINYWSSVEAGFKSGTPSNNKIEISKEKFPSTITGEYAYYKFPSEVPPGFCCYDGDAVNAMQNKQIPTGEVKFVCGSDTAKGNLIDCNTPYWSGDIIAAQRPWDFIESDSTRKYTMFVNGYGVRLLERETLVAKAWGSLLGFFKDSVNYLEEQGSELEKQISGLTEMKFPFISDSLDVAQCYLMNNCMPNLLSTALDAEVPDLFGLNNIELENVKAKIEVLETLNVNTICKQAQKDIKSVRLKTMNIGIEQTAYGIQYNENNQTAAWTTVKDGIKQQVQNESMKKSLVRLGVSQIETINLNIDDLPAIVKVCQRYYIPIHDQNGQVDLTLLPGYINLQQAGKIAKATELLGPTQVEIETSPELNNDKIKNNKYFNTINSIKNDIKSYDNWVKDW